ncbi:hypothetical protein KIN20_016883 [Parelaphostrongylus tenuis]|uniref:Uncharacterized protein n=1 Tax=Parelaphostrongylus tenuis TaxID=148309 RepID=A0AAD5MH54_PARTN|nr:hypothetical protein KIN20_016883 [Parelaphostrongylus tenuis]
MRKYDLLGGHKHELFAEVFHREIGLSVFKLDVLFFISVPQTYDCELENIACKIFNLCLNEIDPSFSYVGSNNAINIGVPIYEEGSPCGCMYVASTVFSAITHI